MEQEEQQQQQQQQQGEEEEEEREDYPLWVVGSNSRYIYVELSRVKTLGRKFREKTFMRCTNVVYPANALHKCCVPC